LLIYQLKDPEWLGLLQSILELQTIHYRKIEKISPVPDIWGDIATIGLYSILGEKFNH